MALTRSKSPRAFQRVIKTEIRKGFDTRRAVGIAFGEADLAKKRDARERRRK